MYIIFTQKLTPATSTPAKSSAMPPTDTTRDASSSFISGSTSSSSSLEDSNSAPQLYIPDIWRPEVSQCLKKKELTDSARNDMIRTLVNILYSVSEKPTRSLCDELARKLILKYPAIKDEVGNGYVSYSLERVSYSLYYVLY